eukprot:scaffold713_cov131-Cylindrotheca_fusiformis.AAC.21
MHGGTYPDIPIFAVNFVQTSSIFFDFIRQEKGCDRSLGRVEPQGTGGSLKSPARRQKHAEEWEGVSHSSDGAMDQ